MTQVPAASARFWIGYTSRHHTWWRSQGQQRDLNPQPPYYKYGELPPHGVAWSRFGCMLTLYGPPQNVRWHHNGYTIGTTHHVRQEKKMSRTVDELAECIRKGDDPATVLRFAIRDAERTALTEAASYVYDELVGDLEMRIQAKRLLLAEADKH